MGAVTGWQAINYFREDPTATTRRIGYCFMDGPKKEPYVMGFAGVANLGAKKEALHYGTKEKMTIDGRQVYQAPVFQRLGSMHTTVVAIQFLAIPMFIAYILVNGFSPFFSAIPFPYEVKILALVLGGCNYLALSWVYHALRIALMPIYLLLHAIYDVCWNKKGVAETCRSHGIALVKEMGSSGWNMIRAPYYAAKFNLGQIAVLLTAFTNDLRMSAVQFVADTERDWNRGTPFHKSWALVGCFQKGFSCEGGGGIDELGANAAIFARCEAQTAIAYFTIDDQGKVKVWRVASVMGDAEPQSFGAARFDFVAQVPEDTGVTGVVRCLRGD